ncbi:MAG: O-antigen ligase family protein [Pseudomonadales bacterium]|nr:O-antigen ligase family protein [Pseudomonadales bacterium]
MPDLPYSFGISLLVLAIALFDRKRTTPTPWISSAPLRWMWMLIVMHGLATFWALLPDYHYRFFDNFLKLGIVVTAAYKLCATRKSLDYYLYAYIFGCAYLGYLLLNMGRNSGARVANFGLVDAPDVNAVAAALVPGALIALHYFLKDKGWSRWLFFVGGALTVNAMVLINSRGAFLGLILGAAYYIIRLFFLEKSVRVSRKTLLVITVMGALALVEVFDQAAIERFFGLREEARLTEGKETGSTRVFFWKAALRMSQDHPWGMGVGGFVMMSPNYIPEHVNTGASRNRAVHSSWFQTLTEVGYLGFFLFLMMIMSAGWATQKVIRYATKKHDAIAARTALALQSCLVSYIISISFLDRMRAVVLYWLIMFAACAYNIYIVQPNTEQASSRKPAARFDRFAKTEKVRSKSGLDHD